MSFEVCAVAPFVVAIAFYFLPERLRDPKKLTVISMLTLATFAVFPCDAYAPFAEELRTIATQVLSVPPYVTFLQIYFHNLVILALCAVLGRAYLGFIASTTAMVARDLTGNYPWKVVLGGHTLLEFYAYSLATTRSKRNLVYAIAYLALAGAIETIALRF